jgi:hypothetical protein
MATANPLPEFERALAKFVQLEPLTPEERALLQRRLDAAPSVRPANALPWRINPGEIPPELKDNALVLGFTTITPDEERVLDALAEADRRYGTDTKRERADLLAGQHPLQAADVER